MQIQLNTDKNFVGSPQLLASVERVLEQELKHVCDELTRIEVHLSDENSDKSGDADKRCLLEARPRGLPPIAVEHRASSVELAIRGAAGQLDEPSGMPWASCAKAANVVSRSSVLTSMRSFDVAA